MDVKLLQPADIMGGSFALLTVGSIGATALLLLGTGWVQRKWKPSLALAAIVTLVASLFYIQAREVWSSAGQLPVIYRYIDWLITMPAQVLALYLFAGALSRPSTGVFWRLLVVSVIMVLARYMGEVGFMHTTLGFLIGIAGWLYILGEMYFGEIANIVGKSGHEAAETGFFWLRLIVTVGWAIYPLCEFIASFGGGVDEGQLVIVFNLADILNQIIFGMVILTVAMSEPASTR